MVRESHSIVNVRLKQRVEKKTYRYLRNCGLEEMTSAKARRGGRMSDIFEEQQRKNVVRVG